MNSYCRGLVYGGNPAAAEPFSHQALAGHELLSQLHKIQPYTQVYHLYPGVYPIRWGGRPGGD